MKKTFKNNYCPPQVKLEAIILERHFTASVDVPNATIGDAEEEEWTVS